MEKAIMLFQTKTPGSSGRNDAGQSKYISEVS